MLLRSCPNNFHAYFSDKLSTSAYSRWPDDFTIPWSPSSSACRSDTSHLHRFYAPSYETNRSSFCTCRVNFLLTFQLREPYCPSTLFGLAMVNVMISVVFSNDRLQMVYQFERYMQTIVHYQMASHLWISAESPGLGIRSPDLYFSSTAEITNSVYHVYIITKYILKGYHE